MKKLTLTLTITLFSLLVKGQSLNIDRDTTHVISGTFRNTTLKLNSTGMYIANYCKNDTAKCIYQTFKLINNAVIVQWHLGYQVGNPCTPLVDYLLDDRKTHVNRNSVLMSKAL